MKRILFFACAVICALLFTDCSKNAQDGKLAGSVWLTNVGTTNYPDWVAIEFTSDSSCKVYISDENLSVGRGGTGSYKKDGNKVTFSSLEITVFFNKYKFLSGEINGQRLLVDTEKGDKGEHISVSFLRKI